MLQSDDLASPLGTRVLAQVGQGPSVVRGLCSDGSSRLLVARLCAHLLLGVAGAAATFTFSPPILAQSEEAKSIAVHIEGPDGDSMNAAIQAIVPETLQVVDPDTFTSALKKAGVRPPLGKAISDERQRKRVLPKIRKALDAAGIEAVVLGLMRKVGARKELYLVYVDRGSDELPIDEPIALRGNEADHLRSIDATLGPVLRDLAPAATMPEKIEPEEKPKEEPDEKKDEKKDEPVGARPKNQVGTALFVIDGGLELGGRWFNYSEPLTENIRPYSVFGAPLINLGGELYPFAGTGVPFIKDLGLTVSFARALGLSSAEEGGESVGTTYQRFDIGLRERIRLGSNDQSAILGIGAGLRLQTFGYENTDIDGLLPDVSYTLVRLGLDLRAPVGPVALLAGFDFFIPMSSGLVYEQFTDPSVLGIALGGGVAIPISSGLEARVRLDYSRFFSSFTPARGDRFIAGGAVDEYLGIRLGAAYAY
ncbi:hypothetical protein [Chondromyces crocatus]|uniref:Uncharacterized protein n=1 Tax=Chondromyces crocatus TaxID=52 RepID=A0A0K1ELC0_CHOCO|nr:hypothetical protein [Chondromyces crocatus]AKT41596.1 uncharacterized protein CMC5_058030 [Chondromyces crocatus]